MNYRMFRLVGCLSVWLLPLSLLAQLDPTPWRIVDVSSENLLTGESAEMAIDGNPETQWHTQWHNARGIEPAQPPHFITIDFAEKHPVSAIRYRSRAHGEGGVAEQYSMELSLDGQTWKTVSEGRFTYRSGMSVHATVTLDKPVMARFLRFTVFSLCPSEKSNESGLVVGEIDVATPDSPLVPTTLIPVPQSREWCYGGYDWRNRHRDLLAYAAAHRPQLVFLGDSITHRWGAEPCIPSLHVGTSVWNSYYGDRNALDLGYGWDRLENMLWRLQHGELKEADPKLVVLMAGTNNLEVNNGEEIALGVAGLCDEIHRQKPKARILLLAIFPRGCDAQTQEQLQKANQLIGQLGKRDYITFKDIGSALLDENGQITPSIMPDWLHPNEEGYRRWAQSIENEVSKALGDTPKK